MLSGSHPQRFEAVRHFARQLRHFWAYALASDRARRPSDHRQNTAVLLGGAGCRPPWPRVRGTHSAAVTADEGNRVRKQQRQQMWDIASVRLSGAHYG